MGIREFVNKKLVRYAAIEAALLRHPDWTGAAGLLLTLLMAKAMNHSVSNILFTKCGTPAIKQTQGDIKGSLEPVEASDVGIFMRYAEDVIIVPKL